MSIRYLKRHQTGQLWNYYKVFDNYPRPTSQDIVFLNQEPMILTREYDLAVASAQIAYEAFAEVGVPISAQEYEAAYARATQSTYSLQPTK